MIKVAMATGTPDVSRTLPKPGAGVADPPTFPMVPPTAAAPVAALLLDESLLLELLTLLLTELLEDTELLVELTDEEETLLLTLLEEEAVPPPPPPPPPHPISTAEAAIAMLNAFMDFKDTIRLSFSFKLHSSILLSF